MALLKLQRPTQLCGRTIANLFQQSTRTAVFYEPHKKSNYAERIKISSKEKKNPLKEAQVGVGLFKEETIKWGREVKRSFRGENDLWYGDMGIFEHGDYEYVFKMNELDEIRQWVVTSDSDLSDGESHGEFVLGPNSTGIFRGNLNLKVPKDGVTKRSGYCNIRSPTNTESFYRVKPFEWEKYTHIVVRMRGDGRPVKLLLGVQREFDVQWNDLYQYPLYTRGGPYWQETKIPFSKFYLTSKGRIQDKQEPVGRGEIIWVGFSIADKVPGPFCFEIDSIAVMYDESHTEEFAYEMYQTRD